MKITADTNVLVRAITGDDEKQSRIAQAQLARAGLVALAIPVLCELVWVLSQGYKISSADIAEAIRRLLAGANVVVNRPAAEAGLTLLDAGGDFADFVDLCRQAFEAGPVHYEIPLDGHWNGVAHGLAADAVAKSATFNRWRQTGY